MSGPDTLRTFIPYGYCVPPEATQPHAVYDQPIHEVFQTIDSGDADESLLILAAHACQSCLQLNYCREQRDEIGNALWRVGASVTIAGGEQVTVGPEPAVNQELETTSFRFDLSILPTEPALYLQFLRQGVRARQLHIVSRPPITAGTIASRYKDLLELRDPNTAEALAKLSDKERSQAFRYMVLCISQQSDFRRYASSFRSSAKGVDNQRYNPDTHDYDTHYGAVELFMRETVELKEMGYQRPSALSMNYSAEYGRRLLDRFGPAFIPPNRQKPTARFYSLVSDNIRDPEGALTAFLARVQEHRVNSGDLPAWVAGRRAYTNRTPAGEANEKARRRQLLDAHGHLGAKAVDQAINLYADAEQQLETVDERRVILEGIYGKNHQIVTNSVIKHYAGQTDFKNAVVAFIGRFEDLEALYGKDADFTEANRQWFARQYSGDHLGAAANFKKRLRKFRGWAAAAAATHDVPDSYLRQRALQGDVGSYEDIAKDYKVKLLKTALNLRNGRRPENDRLKVSSWVFNRLKALYDVEEIEHVGKALINLLGDGTLTTGIAELDELQDPIIQLDVASMADPATRKYLTFASGLENLTVRQRIEFAHDHNLIRLLYGSQFGPEQLAVFLGPAMRTDSNKEHVKVLFSQAVSGERGAEPVPFSLIQHDVAAFLEANIELGPDLGTRHQTVPGDIFAMVGASVVRLRQVRFEESSLITFLPEVQSQWLEQEINTHYPPLERAQALQNVAIALRSGRLVIQDKRPSGYQLSLGEDFRGDHIDQVARAAVAQVMGVVNFLYGKDLSLTLRYRLGTNDLAAYVAKEVLPKVPSWEYAETVFSGIKPTTAALDWLLASFDASHSWYVRGRLMAVSSRAASELQLQRYDGRPSSSWKSHKELAAYAGAHGKDLAEILDHLTIRSSDRNVYVLTDKRLDLFYAPHLSARIRQYIRTGWS